MGWVIPRYQYRCDDCGDFERIMRISEHVRAVTCECGRLAYQVISAPHLFIPAHMRHDALSGYESPIDGRIITNQRARREDMARNGCVEYEPGMREDVDRRCMDNQKSLEKSVDEMVDREISKMPATKLERLDQEIRAGITANIERL